MSSAYPYPQQDIEGYDLEVVEMVEGSPSNPFLPYPLPADEARFAAAPGDLVKLVFRYRDPVEKNGQTITAEHMWVNVTDYGEGCLLGTLNNDPQFTSLLKSDDLIHFHPTHIVRFWEPPEPNQESPKAQASSPATPGSPMASSPHSDFRIPRSNATWPFDQPRNCVTFTMRQVIEKLEPILRVTHDADDHGWQFIGSSDANMTDAKLVCLEHIVHLDPTVLEVADLPPGWQATRPAPGEPWTRRLRPQDPNED